MNDPGVFWGCRTCFERGNIDAATEDGRVFSRSYTRTLIESGSACVTPDEDGYPAEDDIDWDGDTEDNGDTDGSDFCCTYCGTEHYDFDRLVMKLYQRENGEIVEYADGIEDEDENEDDWNEDKDGGRVVLRLNTHDPNTIPDDGTPIDVAITTAEDAVRPPDEPEIEIVFG